MSRQSEKVSELRKAESSVDMKLAVSLRNQLEIYIEDLRSDITELSNGLGISRAALTKFMKTDNHTLITLSPDQLLNLWQELSNLENASNKTYRRTPEEGEDLQELRKCAIAARSKLKEQGPDELLISAGYLPQQMQWIGVSKKRYPQIHQIALLLDNELLGFDIFMKLTQQQLEIVIQELKRQYQNVDGVSPDSVIEKALESHPTINPSLRDAIITKYRRVCDKVGYETIRHRKLTITEALGLFSSILANEITRKERTKLRLRVIRCEFRSLSLSFPRHERWADISKKLSQIAKETESSLRTLGSPRRFEEDEIHLFVQPVTKAIITCSYGYNRSRVIQFSYTSSGTTLSTAINAIALHLGLQRSVSVELETRDLGNDISSLVKCVTVLGEEQNIPIHGEWVDRDLLLTALQSMLVASEKWLFGQFNEGELNEKTYRESLLQLADLRQKFDESRQDFHSYQFVDGPATRSSMGQIAKEALNSQILLTKNGTLLKAEEILVANFFQVYLLARIHQLRQANMFGDLSEGKRLIEEITTKFSLATEKLNPEIVSDILKPVQIMFGAECKLFSLSSGLDNFFFDSTTVACREWLEYIQQEIDDHLKHSNPIHSQYTEPPYQPGFDTYQSQAATSSISGRWLLYLGDTVEALNQASDCFLRASHYFSRIGLGQRAARNLALAGRAQIRLGNANKAWQLRELSSDIVEKNLHRGQRKAFRQAARSEIHLLDGEYHLLISDSPEEGLKDCLQGLKGALWLGLNRRIIDNLYNIWRCSRRLGSLRIEDDLKNIFPILWESEKSLEDKKERLNPLKNSTSSAIIELLLVLKNEAENSHNWSQVADYFHQKAADIWHDWHRQSSLRDDSKHPIGIAIEQEKFLCRVDQN